MIGKIRDLKLRIGRSTLVVDPPKNKWTRFENLKLRLIYDPTKVLERKQNTLSCEMAELIFLKRINALMLDTHQGFNPDVMEGDFFAFLSTHNKTGGSLMIIDR